jgi:hypothetical protein
MTDAFERAWKPRSTCGSILVNFHTLQEEVLALVRQYAQFGQNGDALKVRSAYLDFKTKDEFQM